MASYARQTTESPNPLARYTHRRRLALSAGEVVRTTPEGGTVVDYGCGPGQFLADVGERRKDLRLIGYDPFVEPQFSGVERVASMDAVTDGSVDLLSVLETFEHLDESETAQLVADARRILSPSGRMLVSVPIIGGPALLAKQANRYLIHRKLDYTPSELARAVVGRPTPRAVDIKTSHKGFDFRRLLHRLAADMELERAWLSPFPPLPWGLNSQSFSLWRVSGCR